LLVEEVLMMKVATVRVAAATLLALARSAHSHAFISDPPLRGGTAGTSRNGYMAQSGNGDGMCGDGGQWPQNSDFLGFVGEPVRTYTAGETVTFTVKVTAHHKGFFVFKLCDKHLDHSSTDGDACLNEHVLERADPPSDCVPNDSRGDCQPIDDSNRGYWYLPPPGQNVHEMKYKIPATLSCEKCTLQWRWYTANSCIPDPVANACYFKKMQNLGWNSGAWCGTYCGTCNTALLAANMSSTRKSSAPLNCGEQFRNCADVRVLPSGPTPPPTPAPPTLPPTPAPSTPAPPAKTFAAETTEEARADAQQLQIAYDKVVADVAQIQKEIEELEAIVTNYTNLTNS